MGENCTLEALEEKISIKKDALNHLVALGLSNQFIIKKSMELDILINKFYQLKSIWS